MDLTKRQQEIFDFIKRYSAARLSADGARHRQGGAFASSSTVHAHLANANGSGCWARPDQAARIELFERAAAGVKVRQSGTAAHRPRRRWSARGRGGEHRGVRQTPAFAGGEDGEFLLRVRGESMKEVGILEDDLVVVRPQETAEDGDIVVALVGEEATVKRFFQEADHIRLQPENASMEPIRSRDVRVLGRVVGLMRNIREHPGAGAPECASGTRPRAVVDAADPVR